MNYFVNRAGVEYGPYSADQLRQSWDEGALVADDICRRDPFDEWFTAESFIGAKPEPVPASEDGRAGGEMSASPVQAHHRAQRRWLMLGATAAVILVLMVTVWRLTLEAKSPDSGVPTGPLDPIITPLPDPPSSTDTEVEGAGIIQLPAGTAD